MATTLKFVILGDDQASRSFDRFANSIDRANRNIERNNESLKRQAVASDAATRSADRQNESMKRQSATASSSSGSILQLAGTITGLGDAEAATSEKSGRLQKALGLVGLATGVAEPAVSALVATTGTLATIAGTAAAGLGVFGIVAKAVFSKSATAAQAAQKAQDTYQGAVTKADITYGVAVKKATTAAQRQAATTARQSALQAALATRVAATSAAWAGMTPSQVQLGKAIAGTKTQWAGFVKAASPGVASVLTQGIGLLPRVLQLARPLLAPVEDGLSVILGQLSSALWSKSAAGWVKMLANDAEPVILSLGTDIGNVVTGIGGILHAFLPFQGTVLNGLDSITSRFSKWGSSLGGSSGFQSMITQWKQNWPLMKQGLSSMLTIVKNIGSGMAGMSTPANSKLMWQVANPVLALAAKLSSSPQLVQFMLYLSLIGKGSKQISGVFDSLKTGWNGVAKAISVITGGKLNLGIQGSADTMLVASKNMQAAADTMAGAAVGKGGAAAGGAEAAAGGAAAGAAGKRGLAGFLSGLSVPAALGASGITAGLVNAWANAVTKSQKGDWQPLVQAISGQLQGPTGVLSLSAQGAMQGVTQRGGILTKIPIAGPMIASLQDALSRAQSAFGNWERSAFTSFFTKDVPGMFSGLATWLGANWQKVVIMLGGGIGKAVVAIVQHWQTFQGYMGALVAWLHGQWSGFVNFILGVFQHILNGAADAFGWIPGVGGQLKTAAARFAIFRDNVNGSLAGIKPRSVTVGVNFAPYLPGQQPADIFHFSGNSATGGLIRGPGGPTSDKAGLWALSDREYVIRASSVAKYGVPFMNALNAGKLAAGGLAVRASTPSAGQITGSIGPALQALATANAGALTMALAGMGAAGQAGGAARWASVILTALAMLGQPSTWLGVVEARMNQESGGNPNAINLWDINAQHGDPSRGLMQVIGSTFERWRSWALPDDIWNPLANTFAGLNYALHTYGSLAALSRPGGYARGGLVRYASGGVIDEPVLGVGRSGRRYLLGENGPETVTPGAPRSGPMVHIGEVHVRQVADIDLIAQKLSFAILQAGLG